MSVIMDAVIICMFDDDNAAEQMNKILYDEDECRHQQFHKMDNSSAGGSKFPALTTYQACFNHLSPDTIIHAFLKTEWRRPDNVLILNYEFDEKPMIVLKSDGKWITECPG